MLFDEAILIEERVSNRIATEASLRQSVVAGVFSRKGKSGLAKALKALKVATKPRASAFDQE